MRKHHIVSKGQLSLLQYIDSQKVDIQKMDHQINRQRPESTDSETSPSKKILACVVKTTPREARQETRNDVKEHAKQYAQFPRKRDKLDGLFRHYLSQHTALQRIMKYHREIILSTCITFISTGY